MKTTIHETREQREARVEAGVDGFLRGWFGNAAAFITPEEMLSYIDTADTRDLQFVHRLLCLLHNLMLCQKLYMGMDNSVIDTNP